MKSDDVLKLDHAWLQEEYKALRAEILANEDYQKNLIVFGTSALAAAMGFIYRDAALVDYRTLLLLVTQTLAVSFLFTFERIAYATEEIGTYIMRRIERYTALNWELYLRVTPPPQQESLEAAQYSDGHEPTRRSKPSTQAKARRRFLFDVFGYLPFCVFAILCNLLIIHATFWAKQAPQGVSTVPSVAGFWLHFAWPQPVAMKDIWWFDIIVLFCSLALTGLMTVVIRHFETRLMSTTGLRRAVSGHLEDTAGFRRAHDWYVPDLAAYAPAKVPPDSTGEHI